MLKRSGKLVAVGLGVEEVARRHQVFVSYDGIEVADLEGQVLVTETRIRLRDRQPVVLGIPLALARRIKLESGGLAQEEVLAIQHVDAATQSPTACRQRTLADQVELVQHQFVAAIHGIVRAVELAVGIRHVADKPCIDPAAQVETTVLLRKHERLFAEGIVARAHRGTALTARVHAGHDATFAGAR